MLQIGMKTKRNKGKSDRDSAKTLEITARKTGFGQKTFQMTERISSIYNKSFIAQDSKSQ